MTQEGSFYKKTGQEESKYSPSILCIQLNNLYSYDNGKTIFIFKTPKSVGKIIKTKVFLGIHSISHKFILYFETKVDVKESTTLLDGSVNSNIFLIGLNNVMKLRTA